MRQIPTLLFGACVASACLPRPAAARPMALRPPPSPSRARLNAGLPLKEQVYAPQDREEYFQTWNFYLLTEDGYHVFANFVISHLGIGDNTCGLNIAVVDPSERSQIETLQLPGDEFSGSKRRLRLRCGQVALDGDENAMTLKGDLKQLGVDIRLVRTAPGVSAGKLWLDEDREDFIRYNVPHLGSELTGRIKVRGRWRAVKGKATVEHVLENVGLHRFSRIWHRIRFMRGDTAMIFGGFEPTEDYKNGVHYFFMARGGKVVHVSNKIVVRPTGHVRHGESGYKVPSGLRISLTDPHLSLDGTVSSRKMVGEFDVLQQLNAFLRLIVRTFFANPWVFRHASDLSFTVSIDGGPPETLAGPGMHEIIYVNE
jgi:hypothetical protein